MALNASGQLSLGGATAGQSINLELSKAATAQIGMNDADVRALAASTAGTALTLPGGFWGKSNQLFAFTTHTFTSAGAVGVFGPTLATLQSTYSATGWAANSAYFAQGRAQGYQVFTIPATGTYELELAGARGQNGASISGQYGQGAIIRFRHAFNKGDKLEMVVGQVPGNTGSSAPGVSYAGAGGGSFVAYNGTSTPIGVAGGGAGSYSTYTTQAILHGQTQRRPRWTGYSISPCVDGTHPTLGYGGWTYHGGGGGGFFSSGVAYSGRAIGDTAMGTAGGAQSYTVGAGFVNSTDTAGGPPIGAAWYATGGNGTTANATGGFGGGGGGHSGNNTGGGGGGYTGGPGGQTSLGGGFLSGVGGGSFIISTATTVATSNGQYDATATFNGVAITNIATFNNASGYIKITKI